MSADVPPTSSEMTLGMPAVRPTQIPPMRPATGPEKSVDTGFSAALSAVITPPAEVMRCNSPAKPRSCIAPARPLT